MKFEDIQEEIKKAMGETVKLELPLVCVAMIGRLLFEVLEDDDSDIAQKLTAKVAIEHLAEAVKGTSSFEEFMKKQDKEEHQKDCSCDSPSKSKGHTHVIKINLRTLLGL